jgi:hypothetical protein
MTPTPCVIKNGTWGLTLLVLPPSGRRVIFIERDGVGFASRLRYVILL